MDLESFESTVEFAESSRDDLDSIIHRIRNRGLSKNELIESAKLKLENLRKMNQETRQKLL